MIVTKDRDFIDLVAEPPPLILWIRAGNLSNARLHLLIEAEFATALSKLNQYEAIVELK